VFVNCGAATYTGNMMASIPCANVRCLVIDSHRPIDTRFDNPGQTEHMLLLGEDEALAAEEWPGYNPLDDMSQERERAGAWWGGGGGSRVCSPVWC
jgi:hypothetical protein